ncbi:ribonuclease E/G, partial [Dietzia sp. DQ11-38-2]|nr:ribonuclease E/G [Dietzia sp. DQ11-38-2]
MSDSTLTIDDLNALPEKMRAHAAAKAVGMTSKEFLAAMAGIGVEIRSAQSGVTREVLLTWFAGREDGDGAALAEAPADQGASAETVPADTAPAKKAGAGKAPARKSSEKKAPARKSAEKKAPAEKSPARKTRTSAAGDAATDPTVDGDAAGRATKKTAADETAA